VGVCGGTAPRGLGDCRAWGSGAARATRRGGEYDVERDFVAEFAAESFDLCAPLRAFGGCI
jgi:hypothetical protein